jgi:small subunit ribosomal protein S4
MGDPKKLRKQYETPRKVWDKQRITEERKLLVDYGLKNMRELWTAKTVLRKMRREARRLLAEEGTGVELRKKDLMKRLERFFLSKDSSLEELLNLDVSSVLDRRLESVVFRKGLARTILEARQSVVHGHIMVNGRKCSSPSMLVSFKDEGLVEKV